MGLGRGVFAFKGGETFWDWTVVEWSKENKKYKCVCKCGTERLIRQNTLKSGRTKSCGCNRRNWKDNNKEALEKSYFRTYKNSAKQRGLSFNLDLEDFLLITNKNCFYCGVAPSKIRKNHDKTDSFYRVNGIDRLVSSLGYIDGNCVSCCEVCNKAKLDSSVEDFVLWINRVYRHLHGVNDE